MNTRPFVLGIAGGTASGKSTLTQMLAEHLGERSVLVEHDRYYRDLPAAFHSAPATYNFDHPDALDTDALIDDVDRLRNGLAAELPDFDFVGHKRGPERQRVEPRDFVIVEGILVFADHRLRQRFDLMVYVDTDDDVRLMRRMRRDTAERGRTWQQVLEQYERTVRPMHKAYVAPGRELASVVLDGTAPLADNLARLLALIPT